MSKKGRRCALLFSGAAGRSNSRSKDSTNGATSGSGQCEHVNAALVGGAVSEADQRQQSDTVVVIRVKLHCSACVTEVTRSLQQVQGVKEIRADPKAELMTVKGHQLDGQRLCDAIYRKTGKRCRVLLLTACTSQSDEPSAYSTAEPATNEASQRQEDAGVAAPASCTDIVPAPSRDIIAAPPPPDALCSRCGGPVANYNAAPAPPLTQMSNSNATGSVTSIVQDASEARMEIRQQTHAVIYGWPSSAGARFVELPLPPTPMPHYQGFFSDENPNSCHLM